MVGRRREQGKKQTVPAPGGRSGFPKQQKAAGGGGRKPAGRSGGGGAGGKSPLRRVALTKPAPPATLAERFALLELQRKQLLKKVPQAALVLAVKSGGVKKRRPKKQVEQQAGKPEATKPMASGGTAAAEGQRGAGKGRRKRGGARSRKQKQEKKMDTA